MFYRNLILFFTCFLLTLSLFGCTGNTKTVIYAPGPPLKICVAAPNLYVIAADIVNTRRNISLELIPLNAEAYAKKELPANIDYFSKFDVCIINGMNSDNYLAEELLKLNSKIKIIDASSAVPLMTIPQGALFDSRYVSLSPLCLSVQYITVASAIKELDVIPVSPEEEKKKKDNKTQVHLTAAQEIRARVLHTDKAIFKNYHNTVEKTGLKPISLPKTSGETSAVAPKMPLQNAQQVKTDSAVNSAPMDAPLNIYALMKESIRVDLPTSFYVKDLRTSGELLPVAAEEAYFDYLARDFGLVVQTRISSSAKEADLQKLSSDGKNLIVLLSSGTEIENQALVTKFPQLRLCFLKKDMPRELYPDTLQKIMNENFASIASSFAGNKK